MRRQFQSREKAISAAAAITCSREGADSPTATPNLPH